MRSGLLNCIWWWKHWSSQIEMVRPLPTSRWSVSHDHQCWPINRKNHFVFGDFPKAFDENLINKKKTFCFRQIIDSKWSTLKKDENQRRVANGMEAIWWWMGCESFGGDGGPFWMKWYLNLDAVSFCGLALRRVFIFNNDYALMSKQPLIEGTPLEREDSFFSERDFSMDEFEWFFFVWPLGRSGYEKRNGKMQMPNAHDERSIPSQNLIRIT